MIEIDGSQGEGGGQILRTALALSAVTGKPFCMDRIRARRTRPGLAAQHLTCVEAAAVVCSGRVDGARIGSTCLTFTPGDVVHMDRTFAVGTAGATALVAQTVLPPLLVVAGRSRLVFEGGTHGKMAPSSDFLARTFVPVLQRLGASLSIEVERCGFYPAGGGRIVIVVEGAAAGAPVLSRLSLLEPGRLTQARVRALVSRLPRHIGVREVEAVQAGLREVDVGAESEVVELEGRGPGNAVVLDLQHEHITEVVTGTGERGKAAEAVAKDVVDAAHRYLHAGVPVGEHLADQLLLPLALGAGGTFRTLPPTEHTRTNIATIARFLDVAIAVVDEGGGVTRIDVGR